jgi:hypothetical protein
MADKLQAEPEAVENRSIEQAQEYSTATSMRNAPWQNYQSGVDPRGRNVVIRDGTSTDVVSLGQGIGGPLGLFSNDSEFDRIFIGKNADGEYIAQLSKEGYDAKTATGDELIWSSTFNNFKIIGSPVTVDLAITSSTTEAKQSSVSVAHGLGTAVGQEPAYLAFNTVDNDLLDTFGLVGGRNGPNPSIYVLPSSTDILTYLVAQTTVDATNINLTVCMPARNPATVYTFSAKVFLLQETAV